MAEHTEASREDYDPLIVFDESIVAIWYCVVGEMSDFLLGVNEVVPDAEYRFGYRFKYYSPGSTDPFDGKDERSCFTGTIRETRFKAVEGMRVITNTLLAAIGSTGELWELVNDGDFDKFMKAFMAAPWAHFKEIPQP